MGLAVYTSRLFVSWVVMMGLVLMGAGAVRPAFAAPAQGKRAEAPASAKASAAPQAKAKKPAAAKAPAKKSVAKKPAAKKAVAKKPARKAVVAKAAPAAAKAKGTASVSRAATAKSAKPAAAKTATRNGGRGKKAVASRGGSKRVARSSRRASRPKVVKHRRPMPALPAGVADDALLARAASHIGTPYRFGGASAAGMDCSGFTRTVFSEIGLALPHSASGQFNMGERVARYELQPGDLVFFRTYRRGASHVGIYVGDDLFIHAASRGGIVRVDTLDDRYYRSRYLGARRLRPSES